MTEKIEEVIVGKKQFEEMYGKEKTTITTRMAGMENEKIRVVKDGHQRRRLTILDIVRQIDLGITNVENEQKRTKSKKEIFSDKSNKEYFVILQGQKITLEKLKDWIYNNYPHKEVK